MSDQALAAVAGGEQQGSRREPAPLSSYVPRLALQWMAESPQERHRSVEGALAFVDVSGFTALTERLAVRGRAGAEEITDIIGGTFTELAQIAAGDGADLLKWGGDAALLLFDGSGATERAARSAQRMVQAMSRLGRMRTSAGRVQLQVSVGVHSGQLELFLLGELHRELVVAGPGATRTAEMESIASAGEVVISPATAEVLARSGQAGVLGERKDAGVLLRGEPQPAEPWRPQARRGADDERAQGQGDEHAATLLPERARRYLLAGGEQAEHRPVAVGFVQLSGLDALVEERGPTAAVEVLDRLVSVAQEAAERHRASFHATDLAADGLKIILLGGVPTLHGNDADRVVQTALEIVRAGTGAPAGPAISVRAGVNVGKTFVFVGDLGLGGRRVYSMSGDAVNLAARVAAAAAPDEVRCTPAGRDALRTPYRLVELPPFRAKGKSEPVVTFAVGDAVEAGRRRAAAAAGFVGRERELAALLDEAKAVRAGSPGRVVELIGPPGIGKSRLVDEAVERWGLPTDRIACDSFGVARPYRALRPFARRLLILDDAADADLVADVLLATLERHAPELAPWAPLLGDVLDVTMPSSREVDELDPRFRRARLESAFVALAATVLPAPAAIVFEDVHGLDEASASLCVRLAEEAAERAWLVVATRRPDGPGVPAGALEDRLVVELEALDAGASARLLGALDERVLAPDERLLLVERAAGNPLFLLELGRAAAASGSVEALPDSLEPLLAVQVDQLSPSDRSVLRAAAVLGPRFDEQLLAAVLDDPALLDAAVWDRLAEFVRPEPGGQAFRHALLRDAAYEGLSFRRRHELHARAATAIEARATSSDEAVELLSLHWLAAERWERAWQCARQAGERAVSLYANRDAATHFRRALQAARHLRLAPAEKAGVEEALGDVCERAGAYQHAGEAYAAARRHVARRVERARLLRKTGNLHLRYGRYPQALRCYAVAGQQLDAGADAAAERAELSQAVAVARHRQGRLRESMTAAIRAGQEAELAGYRRGLAIALNMQFLNSVSANEADDELGYRALAIFAELGDVLGQGLARNQLGLSACQRGDWAAAIAHYEASRDACTRAGNVVEGAIAENNIAEILSDQGRLDEAEQRLEAARAAWHAARFRIGDAVATLNLGRLALRRGESDRAVSLLEQAYAGFEAIRAETYLAESELRLLECLLATGELLRAAEGAAELATRLAGRPGHERVHAGTLRLHGVALLRLGLLEPARERLELAIARWRELADRFELAHTLVARSALWSRLGSDELAAVDDGEAQGLFEHLGVLPAARSTFAAPPLPAR